MEAKRFVYRFNTELEAQSAGKALSVLGYGVSIKAIPWPKPSTEVCFYDVWRTREPLVAEMEGR